MATKLLIEGYLVFQCFHYTWEMQVPSFKFLLINSTPDSV